MDNKSLSHSAPRSKGALLCGWSQLGKALATLPEASLGTELVTAQSKRRQ